MDNCGSAVISVTGFLRGQPINHDTPPAPQLTRSKPDRPLYSRTGVPYRLFIIRRAAPPRQGSPKTRLYREKLHLRADSLSSAVPRDGLLEGRRPGDERITHA